MLRVVGSSCKIHADAESYFQQEKGATQSVFLFLSRLRSNVEDLTILNVLLLLLLLLLFLCSSLDRLPWAGRRDCLIDRFDVRAEMADIPLYDPATAPVKKLSGDEQEIQQLCNFERYRDIVDKRRLGGLKHTHTHTKHNNTNKTIVDSVLVSEKDHLEQMDDWWDALFERKSKPKDR
jgi:hypothetical protein